MSKKSEDTTGLEHYTTDELLREIAVRSTEVICIHRPLIRNNENQSASLIYFNGDIMAIYGMMKFGHVTLDGLMFKYPSE